MSRGIGSLSHRHYGLVLAHGSGTATELREPVLLVLKRIRKRKEDINTNNEYKYEHES